MNINLRICFLCGHAINPPSYGHSIVNHSFDQLNRISTLCGAGPLILESSVGIRRLFTRLLNNWAVFVFKSGFKTRLNVARFSENRSTLNSF